MRAPQQAIDKVIALYQSGNVKSAEKQCLRALKSQPQSYDLRHFLGMLYLREGRYAKALDALKAALKLRQDDGNLFNNLGMACYHLGKFEPAIEYLQKSLAMISDPGIFRHLAAVYVAQGDMESADANYREFVQRSPSSLARLEYGEFLRRQSRYEEAEALFQQVAQSTPPSATEEWHRIGKQQTDLYIDWLRFDKVYEAFESFVADNETPANFSLYLFHLNYHPELSGEELFAFYQRYNQLYAVPAEQRFVHTPGKARASSKLRVGYVSGDMNNAHSVSKFAMPLLEHHDRDLLDITLYFSGGVDAASYYKQGPHADKISEAGMRSLLKEQEHWRGRYKQHADRWRDVTQQSDEELAKQIQRDQIDVLVELSGHTEGERLRALSYKPAPVQVSWLGYGYTTGLEAIDYYLGEAEFTPPGCEHLYSEQIYPLSVPPFAYLPNSDMPEVGPLPALANGFIRFGSFSRAVRFNDKVLACWAELLKRVPNSVLVFNTSHFEVPRNRDIFIEKFAGWGVGPEQLEFLSTRGVATWQEYQKIDIALDPFPHNAGTTTYDALWMGAPVLSLAGSFSLQCFGAMILRRLGLDEWLVDSAEDYVERGAALAADLDALQELRAGLRARMQSSEFMDQAGFARAMEQAYQDMYQRFLDSAQ
ncbi:MAG: tetratricopeptide repeat protein [Halieaceae bacterium]